LLRRLYVQFKIPTDQFKRRPEDFQNFVQMWNDLSGRSDTAGDVLHYMVTKRKAGARLNPRWPVFDGNHRTAPSTSHLFNEKEWAIIEEIYRREILSLGIGTDSLAFDEELADRVAEAFARRTGRIIPPLIVAAAIEARRKRGEWLTLRDDFVDPNIGFGDLDELGDPA
jgi:hypothetical protein